MKTAGNAGCWIVEEMIEQMNVSDPVCGKDLDLADAIASEVHESWAYFFCSPECHRAFKRSPDRFIEQLSRDSEGGARLSADLFRTAS